MQRTLMSLVMAFMAVAVSGMQGTALAATPGHPSLGSPSAGPQPSPIPIQSGGTVIDSGYYYGGNCAWAGTGVAPGTSTPTNDASPSATISIQAPSTGNYVASWYFQNGSYSATLAGPATIQADIGRDFGVWAIPSLISEGVCSMPQPQSCSGICQGSLGSDVHVGLSYQTQYHLQVRGLGLDGPNTTIVPQISLDNQTIRCWWYSDCNSFWLAAGRQVRLSVSQSPTAYYGPKNAFVFYSLEDLAPGVTSRIVNMDAPTDLWADYEYFYIFTDVSSRGLVAIDPQLQRLWFQAPAYAGWDAVGIRPDSSMKFVDGVIYVDHTDPELRLWGTFDPTTGAMAASVLTSHSYYLLASGGF